MSDYSRRDFLKSVGAATAIGAVPTWAALCRPVVVVAGSAPTSPPMQIHARSETGVQKPPEDGKRAVSAIAVTANDRGF
jgi:TAT (twin-arginine translocation) pathway signal sequence